MPRLLPRLVGAFAAAMAIASPAMARVPQPADPMPTAAEQRAAVARVAALGVPIYRAGGQKRYVALTFDDGPGPYTGKVLDELAKYRFRATWFVVGKNIGGWRDTLRREAREGAVGDHTWSHRYLPGLPPGRQVSEVERSIRASTAVTGDEVMLFRPPYGSTTTGLNAWLADHDILPVLWSADSRDSLGAGKEEILRISERAIGPGAIILLHENRGQTYWAVNRLLPIIRNRGYKAVTVPELLALNPPDLAQVRRRAGSGIGFR